MFPSDFVVIVRLEYHYEAIRFVLEAPSVWHGTWLRLWHQREASRLRINQRERDYQLENPTVIRFICGIMLQPSNQVNHSRRGVPLEINLTAALDVITRISSNRKRTRRVLRFRQTSIRISKFLSDKNGNLLTNQSQSVPSLCLSLELRFVNDDRVIEQREETIIHQDAN